MTQKPILGWHFTETDRLAHGDDREIVVGQTLRHEGKLVPCESGLHLSVRAVDALKYAQGNICWRVRGSVERLSHGDPVDKWVCRERTALWRVDAEKLLRRFARSCALDVVHLWNPPKVVLRWLVYGKVRDQAAARAAARAVAGAAAWDAAQDAAWAAAQAAARAAAQDAAQDAARAAARADAGAVAGAAAWDAAQDAAWDAAWAAAGAAAWAKQNKRPESWLHAAHRGELDYNAPLEVSKIGRKK